IRDLFSHRSASPHIYTLSLHDALPIFPTFARAETTLASLSDLQSTVCRASRRPASRNAKLPLATVTGLGHLTCFNFCACRGKSRSEEHTSELQSRGHLVCRLLLEKKKK